MSENTGTKNGNYKRKLRTKNGEYNINVLRDREGYTIARH
jgi:transposase-like protein